MGVHTYTTGEVTDNIIKGFIRRSFYGDKSSDTARAWLYANIRTWIIYDPPTHRFIVICQTKTMKGLSYTIGHVFVWRSEDIGYEVEVSTGSAIYHSDGRGRSDFFVQIRKEWMCAVNPDIEKIDKKFTGEYVGVKDVVDVLEGHSSTGKAIADAIKSIPKF